MKVREQGSKGAIVITIKFSHLYFGSAVENETAMVEFFKKHYAISSA
jgi:hypothetical protein